MFSGACESVKTRLERNDGNPTMIDNTISHYRILEKLNTP
jgi:hypothetical protein